MYMGSFRNADFIERQNAATKAKKAALEKFRANAVDPAFAERRTARMADTANRATAKKAHDVERAEKKAPAAEVAKQAERDAAALEERALIESANRDLAKQAEGKAARDARYAARKARSKRR
jgi:Family of unknown function (DUF6481)